MVQTSPPQLKFITPEDIGLIHQIAAMYYQEWNIPEQVTVDRLTNLPAEFIPFHVALLVNGMPVATGGLHYHVGLVSLEPRFAHLGPWISLVFTVREYRNRGLGAQICTVLEGHAKSLGVERLYLYTATAENLYARLNWTATERFIYRDLDTVLMWKKL